MTLYNVAFRVSSGPSEHWVKAGMTTVQAADPHSARATAVQRLHALYQADRYPRITVELTHVEEVTEVTEDRGDG